MCSLSSLPYIAADGSREQVKCGHTLCDAESQASDRICKAERYQDSSSTTPSQSNWISRPSISKPVSSHRWAAFNSNVAGDDDEAASAEIEEASEVAEPRPWDTHGLSSPDRHSQKAEDYCKADEEFRRRVNEYGKFSLTPVIVSAIFHD